MTMSGTSGRRKKLECVSPVPLIWCRNAEEHCVDAAAQISIKSKNIPAIPTDMFSSLGRVRSLRRNMSSERVVQGWERVRSRCSMKQKGRQRQGKRRADSIFAIGPLYASRRRLTAVEAAGHTAPRTTTLPESSKYHRSSLRIKLRSPWSRPDKNWGSERAYLGPVRTKLSRFLAMLGLDLGANARNVFKRHASTKLGLNWAVGTGKYPFWAARLGPVRTKTELSRRNLSGQKQAILAVCLRCVVFATCEARRCDAGSVSATQGSKIQGAGGRGRGGRTNPRPAHRLFLHQYTDSVLGGTMLVQCWALAAWSTDDTLRGADCVKRSERMEDVGGRQVLKEMYGGVGEVRSVLPFAFATPPPPTLALLSPTSFAFAFAFAVDNLANPPYLSQKPHATPSEGALCGGGKSGFTGSAGHVRGVEREKVVASNSKRVILGAGHRHSRSPWSRGVATWKLELESAVAGEGSESNQDLTRLGLKRASASTSRLAQHYHRAPGSTGKTEILYSVYGLSAFASLPVPVIPYPPLCTVAPLVFAHNGAHADETKTTGPQAPLPRVRQVRDHHPSFRWLQFSVEMQLSPTPPSLTGSRAQRPHFAPRLRMTRSPRGSRRGQLSWTSVPLASQLWHLNCAADDEVGGVEFGDVWVYVSEDKAPSEEKKLTRTDSAEERAENNPSSALQDPVHSSRSTARVDGVSVRGFVDEDAGDDMCANGSEKAVEPDPGRKSYIDPSRRQAKQIKCVRARSSDIEYSPNCIKYSALDYDAYMTVLASGQGVKQAKVVEDAAMVGGEKRRVASRKETRGKPYSDCRTLARLLPLRLFKLFLQPAFRVALRLFCSVLNRYGIHKVSRRDVIKCPGKTPKVSRNAEYLHTGSMYTRRFSVLCEFGFIWASFNGRIILGKPSSTYVAHTHLVYVDPVRRYSALLKKKIHLPKKEVLNFNNVTFGTP
ncbi:hypothetical protein C8R45DRAFT_939448 [Mycena sanguinolenta]|nr:hypothetical protein C8R45DRAFT_939448 [Mycena sanguinolenta]